MNSPEITKFTESVLVVDDDPIFCELLVSDLMLRGVKVVSAFSLQDAAEVLKKHHFDVVILDNHLPDGQGIELLPALQQAEPPPYVIMVSIDDQLNSISESFSQGVHDYIVKPVSIGLLWEKIRNLLTFKRTSLDLANKYQLIQQLLSEKAQEESLAQHVYQNMANSQCDLPAFAAVRSRPMTNFSGDTIFSPPNPTGKIQLILADAMGHGLAAAICIIPIVTTAKAMANKGKTIDEIFHEINRKLYTEIPDDRFVALLGIEICPYSSTVTIVNAGLPDVLCCCKHGEVKRFKSKAMPLGIMEPGEFSIKPEQLVLEEIDQLALYTDGIIEQTNPAGDAYTSARLMAQAKALVKNQQSLIHIMDDCLQFADGNAIEDDITLCVINGEALRNQLQTRTDEAPVSFGEIDYQFCIRGKVIASLDVLNQAMQIMQNSGLPRDLCQKAFTVMAELINNALDHGILHLDSKLKNDFEGFATYLALREERLNNLTNSDQLTIQIYTNSTTFIKISVEDSGSGFALSDSSADQQGLSGRGLGLVDAMCQTVERNAQGNRTTISIARN
ncbi:SpoIIE family protein phosphatase [uncultured Alteromonas sp.]|jgi:CheY-like chemotaxis protein/anti-sigma regulatory factor (Ser/Thr protein kinase)|uniref:ATP-binding SpoIIE family protein phosphatase n=1 Tax=uncultured Alteromonas sp. TaxID=179113 RepID=UPI0025CF8CC8|nr:SpoIIE family protein phosphatase [uncultured Alteromonas sp.]